MSDNSSGSSGSSNNSWTLLSPEEVAIDTAGPLDDGTESIGDVPSLSEEIAGSSSEAKPSEIEAPQETILSEEGHQVCQETSPELFEEGAASGPGVETDPEICAPVIHATITTSPPDNDLLGAVPFSIATESSHFLSQEPFLETFYEESLCDLQPTCLITEAEATSEFEDEIGSASFPVSEISPISIPASEIGPASEAVSEIGPASEPVSEIAPVLIPVSEIGPASIPVSEIGPASEPVSEIAPVLIPVSEIGPASEAVSEIGPASEPVSEIVPTSEPASEIGPASEPAFEIGPASEPVLAAESPYPETTASSVLEEEELPEKSIHVTREAEFLDDPIELRREDRRLRQRHVHYPEELRHSSDEEDREEMEFKLPDRREEKPGLSMIHLIIGALALLCLGSFFFSDDFDGSELSDQELLEKLVEENKQISILDAQIQAQKEELDRALRAAAQKGFTDKEHERMKEELSVLPSLKEELEALKALVSELTQLTGERVSVPFSPAGPERRWGKKDELRRQKTLLEQSKTRLEGMKKQDWPKKWLRERLVEMQQRLSEQVDRIGKKDEWRRKHKEGENRVNERSDGVQTLKELLTKYRDDWENNKAERKLERERRKQERDWQARPSHKHKHDQKINQHHESKDFWKHQENKLRRNQNPPEHCRDVSGCAEAEGLIRVKLSDFQGLLDSYMNKLQGLSAENKEAFHRLVAQFFHGGVFSHDRMLFSVFAEDVADILEDLMDVLTDDDLLEEEMEEFEREALWQFAS